MVANLERKGKYCSNNNKSSPANKILVFYELMSNKFYVFINFRDLNLTLPKQGTTGKHGVANLSFTYTYADKQRYQKQLSLEQEEEDSVEKERKISRKYRYPIDDDKFTRF